MITNKKQLIAYIDDLLHSCLEDYKTHRIKFCKERRKHVERFTELYYNGKWQPSIFNTRVKYGP
jgi:hypothetical protein